MPRDVLLLHVNGETREVAAPVHRTLLEVLRESLDLTGTKHGCELGDCGACTVLIDGEPHLSCITLAAEVEGREITTIEGVSPKGGTPHPLQLAFAEIGAAQCGYCTPGIILSSLALLDGNPSPSDGEIKWALSGNICRCGAYPKIIEAVRVAAEHMLSESGGTRGGRRRKVEAGGDWRVRSPRKVIRLRV